MKIVKRVLLALLVILAVAIIYNYPKLNIISGYASKNLASSVYVAGRTEQSIIANDNNVPLVELADERYDSEQKTAFAEVFGLMERETVCREGLGCVLVNEDYDKSQPLRKPNRRILQDTLPFPYGNQGVRDTVFANVDYEQLQKAVDGAFANYEKQKTRTVAIAYKGELIAERYGEGFSAETPILGWSMTKSILATLYGILEYQGKLKINDFYPMQDDSGKAGINLDHLLRMQSGLAWDEDYTSISDVTEMLFLDADMTLKQPEQEVIASPTEIWNYSSGTSNWLSGILRGQFQSHQEYLDFPYSALIDRIGMHSMLIETDMSGNYVGSSYGWANTRDWVKFGILHLNRGDWNGDQVFGPHWVDYITRPTDLSNGTYGAHWWLNAEGKYPDVPRDLYSANGYQGQYVFVIPSKDLVVVRTGLMEEPNFDVNAFLSAVVQAIQ